MTTSPPDPQQLRIGIIGAGGNTVARHIPGLQAIEGVQIVAVCNRSRASSERVASQFAIPTVYERWSEVVAAPDIDAIVIGTWPVLHHSVTLAALAANKHVLCEARMAANAHEAHEMRALAQLHPELIAQVVPSPMTLRVDATIQRMLANGDIGDLLAIDIRDGNAFLDRDTPLHWRQDADLSGVNIMSLGIWYEAMMRWTGEAMSVMASGRTFATMRKDSTGRLRAVRVPEHLDVIASLVCGAQAHLQISSVTGMAGPAAAWLFGSEGTLRFSENRLFVGRRGDAELVEVAIPAAEEGRWRVEEEFVAAIRGQEPVTHTTFEDGVKYMDFTEAVYRSLASGAAVALPLLD